MVWPGTIQCRRSTFAARSRPASSSASTAKSYTPPDSVTTEELLALVDDLNRRDEIDGILVQLPLPAQVDAKKVLLAVSRRKMWTDFIPMNVGYLSTQRPGLVPCTPAGIIEILKRSNIPIAGREAVVVGRSDIVGKPAAMLLLNANATVTVCHSKTRDLPRFAVARTSWSPRSAKPE